jgi:peroxisomal 2,4-dienoyl-CoA reductase
VDYAISQFGKVDILVNGAAGNFLAEAKSLTPRGFKTVMDIDAQGTFNMSHAVYPAMITSGNGGAIINISMTLHYGGENFHGDTSSSLPLGLLSSLFSTHRLRQQSILLL